MVKAAPSNHPLNKLRPALSNIRQGANGWGGSRIWPLFEILGEAGGHTRGQLLSQIHDKQGEEILNYFSSFSTVGQTMDNWVETVSEDNLSAAPAPKPNPVTFGTDPRPRQAEAAKAVEAPAPAAGSKAEALASLLAATLSEGEEETGSAIAKLQSDLTALATRMGNDLGAVEAKAVEAAEAAAKSGGGASLSRLLSGLLFRRPSLLSPPPRR